MNRKLPTLLALAALPLLLLTVDASRADAGGAKCYRADQDSGFLEFAGAVEGSGFTGRFGQFEAEFCLVGDPADGRIRVRVATASADSQNRDRDEALLGEEFFHVERFPEARWESRAIEEVDGGYRADGELEMRGISKPQSVDFRLEPCGETLHASGAFSMSGQAEVDRQRFEVGLGEFADPEFVRNRVEVRFELEFRRSD